MLYFRFNTDNFIAPKQIQFITPYKDGQPISETYTEEVSLSLGEIETYFFEKLRTELGLNEIGIGHAMYDVLDIPSDSFSVNDEAVGNCDGVLKYVFSEYTKLPIKELNDKSLQDLGIAIEFCKRIENDKNELLLSHYVQQNGLSYITEDVLWKNMTDEEKARKFSAYFEKISSAGKELIIVDPYLFKDESDDYCNLLTLVINNSKAQSVIIITEQKNYRQSSYDKITNNLNTTVTIKYNNDFHDRFWIADRRKGFYTGTSFNGVGKRIALINLLSPDDVTEIITELTQQTIIS